MNKGLIFDSHAHYDDKAFDSDRDELISSLPDCGIGRVMNVGCSLESSRASLALAQKFPFFYAAAGIHPHDASNCAPGDADRLKELLLNEKVKALGEIGLDYHYDFSPRETQKEVFAMQLELSRETGMPVIIHEREAWQDTVDIINAYPGVHGVFHCFSGNTENAKYLLKHDFIVSFTGVVTFKNARKAKEVLGYIADDCFMIETDSPYMSPEPRRGTRNDSRGLHEIAAKIAEIRNTDKETIVDITARNAEKFFNIND